MGGQSMFWDGFQWVPRADTGGAANDINASRKNRRLYLGNLPYHLGVTEDAFSKQLYETMRDRGMCNDPNQNPVLHVGLHATREPTMVFVKSPQSRRRNVLCSLMACWSSAFQFPSSGRT